MHPWEISNKGDPLHVTTAILEVRQTGWPCSTETTLIDAAANDAAVAACYAGPPMLKTRPIWPSNRGSRG